MAIQGHPKSECWVCDKHIYSLLLWSRGRAYVLNPILDSEEADVLRLQVNQLSESGEDIHANPGLGFVNGSLPYDELPDRVPYITGTFTGWRYKQMTPLHEFTKALDPDYLSPFDEALK